MYPECAPLCSPIVPKIKAATVEAHRAATIDKLLDAFGSLVLSRGYTGLSFADIASETDLARTAVYNYFPDLEAMLFAWTEREVANAITDLEHDVRNVSSATDKLRVFIHHQLKGFASRHLPPGREVMSFLNPEVFQRFMRHLEPLERIIRKIVEDGIASGELAAADPAQVVPMVMASIGSKRGAVSTGSEDLELATDALTDFLSKALGAH